MSVKCQPFLMNRWQFTRFDCWMAAECRPFHNVQSDLYRELI